MSGFIMEYDAPVSKKAATLIGLAYLEGSAFMVIMGSFCAILTALIWKACPCSCSESDSDWEKLDSVPVSESYSTQSV